MSFTAEQFSIIEANPNENFKVIAVPGSGKSTVLVHRIGFFLSNGVSPDRILVLMFNDSAVVNFRTDLEQLEFMALPAVKTYHSLAKQICLFLSQAGYMPKLELVPEQHLYRKFYQSVLESTVPANLFSKLNPKNRATVDDFIKFVELIKSRVSTPELIFREYKLELHKQIFITAFKLSEDMRLQQKIQFFSDLVYDAINVCRSDSEAYGYITNRYEKVLVDEYQDSNRACHELLKLVAGHRAKINVVGDDDQTIYDFTGSSPHFLMSHINEDFKNVQLYTLTKTFRFGHSVALVANNVISNNKERIDKLCISGREDLFTEIKCIEYNQESNLIDCQQPELIKQITDWIVNGGEYTDIAFLFRQYSNTFGIELSLLNNGIPYFIAKKNSTVIHSRDFSFLTACIAILCQYTDFTKREKNEAFFTYLSGYMWNIDKSALIPCIELALTDDLKAALSLLDNIGPELREQERKAIKRRLKTFDKVKRTRKYTLDNILKKLINDAGINIAVAKSSWREPELAIAKFDALLSFACSIDDSVDVAHKSLLQLKIDIETTFQSSGIELTTLHKSKGLAWPFVIMPYLEEGIIPSFEAISDPYQIEVERRLFYVGITRARQKLAFHIPRDDLLKRSLIKFTGTMNEVDYFAADRASRFVYETNLLSATTIAVDLRLHHLNTSVSNTGNRALYNKYLHALGKSYRVSGLASEG